MGVDDAFPRTWFRALRQVLAVRARVQVRAALLAECQPEQLGAGEGRLRERGREASGFAADASPGRCDEVAGTSSTGAAKAATASRERRNHIVFTLFSRGVGTGANPRCAPPRHAARESRKGRCGGAGKRRHAWFFVFHTTQPTHGARRDAIVYAQ